MVVDLQEIEALSAPDRFTEDDAITTAWADSPDGALELEGVEAIARSIDRFRRMCERIGPMTLRAEVFGVPAELICAALDEISLTGERVLEHCLEP